METSLAPCKEPLSPHLLPHAFLDLLQLPGVICFPSPEPAQRLTGLLILPLGDQETGRVGHEVEQDDHHEDWHFPCHGQPAPVELQSCTTQRDCIRGRAIWGPVPSLPLPCCRSPWSAFPIRALRQKVAVSLAPSRYFCQKLRKTLNSLTHLWAFLEAPHAGLGRNRGFPQRAL